jgi:hypothetical protein
VISLATSVGECLILCMSKLHPEKLLGQLIAPTAVPAAHLRPGRREAARGIRKALALLDSAVGNVDSSPCANDTAKGGFWVDVKQRITFARLIAQGVIRSTAAQLMWLDERSVQKLLARMLAGPFGLLRFSVLVLACPQRRAVDRYRRGRARRQRGSVFWSWPALSVERLIAIGAVERAASEVCCFGLGLPSASSG